MAFLIPNFDLAQKINATKVEIDAQDVDELIRVATERYGEAFTQAIATSTLLVNGRSVARIKGGKTPLSSADSVWIVTPSGGG